MQYHAALDTSATTTAICVVKAKDGAIVLETSVLKSTISCRRQRSQRAVNRA